MLTGLSIALAAVQVEWTPSLHRAATSSRESRPMVAHPSPPGVVPSQPVASTAVATEVMVAILVATKAGSEVTLVIPPASAIVEEGRETGLPTSPVGGPHGSPF